MKTKRRKPKHPSAAPGPVASTSSWSERLFQPVDAAGLAFFRVAFGAIMLWEVARHFYHNWILETYVIPPFHFTYHGFAWVRPWPGVGMVLHFLVLGVSAVMILVGFRYRAAMAVFCAAFWYVALLDKAVYLNHFYLVGVLSFLMIFTPAHRTFSLDARLDPSRASPFVPAWSLWLLRAQVAIPYLYGGLVKLNDDWLHGQPMELWLGRMSHIRPVLPPLGDDVLALGFSYGGLFLDLLVVPGLLWRRTRPLAFAAATAFHLLNAAMFWIGIFPWLMICATTLFLSPDWPRRLLRLSPAKGEAPPATAGFHSPRRKAALAFFGLYFAFQLLFPARHWLYPGNVDWTEEGARFAWRMMLHSKECALTVFAVDEKTGQSQPLNVQPFLTDRQLNKMSEDPEMAREFAALLKRQFAREGHDLEIRMLVFASLNGRQPQLLLDPTVDLGAQTRTLAPKPWIIPLTEPLPEEPWDAPPSEWAERLDLPRIVEQTLGRRRR